MLKGNNILKNYVLKGVNLEVKKGEIVSITGASGAGKSTLLHILGTLDKADAGSLMINNIDVFKLKDKDLNTFRNEQLGFIFQFHHLLPEFTALENVCLPGWIKKENKQAVNKKATELLAYIGLQDRLMHRPNQLSGGEQQRVAIARALLNNPSLILADEPTGNLDSANSNSFFELIKQLRKELNQTFIIITHNMELAKASDRIIELADGKVVA
jgi:lipoprotein-releasing system ATP-binding protein